MKHKDRLLIGICGSMGVGKTTLAESLQESLSNDTRYGSVILIPEVARVLISKGITSDQQTKFDDYAHYFSGHLDNINNIVSDTVIIDATLLDSLAHATVNHIQVIL